MKICATILLAMLGLVCVAALAAEPQHPIHPNLLLNREEIQQVKAKIQKEVWAAQLLERVKELAKDAGQNVRETALAYALTGDRSWADRARHQLVHNAGYMLPQYEKLDLKLQPEFGAWTSWSTYAWAYDLTYDTFSDEERQTVERWIRTGCKTTIEGEKLWTTTANLVFDKHFNVAMAGFCLGDKELIEWGLSDPGAHGPHKGGFFPVLDSMIVDRYFWSEAPIYALHYDVPGMLGLAEAARHYDGTDLYNYVSKKSGASIKSLLDGYIRMAYPLEKTGIGRGAVRMATYGDGSTGYGPSGTLVETFLAPSDMFCGDLEIAYKRYKDPGYAWLLRLNEQRDSRVTYGRAVWGYLGLTHGEVLPQDPTPQPAPSGLYPSQGFVFLRSDETPAYWTSGAMAALLMLGKPIGHGHNDFYSLTLHAKGRLLYPDLNVIQYEPTYLNWTHEGIGHSTLLVDRQSPQGGPFTTRQDFNRDVKFFAIEGSAFKGVAQARVLLLAKEYLADIFKATDRNGEPRTFDWVLHGLGRLYPGNPAAYRPTDALLPSYWWVENERGRVVSDSWRMAWIQTSAGITPGMQFGKDWFEQAVGVRMTMLDAKETQVYYGDGPLTDGPPYGRICGNPEGAAPMVVARRQAPATTFIALHEPYQEKPPAQQLRRFAETEKAVALVVRAPEFTDYLMVAFDGEEHTLVSPDGEAFTFRNYGYLRVARTHGRDGRGTTGVPPVAAGCGDLLAFQLKAEILDEKANVHLGEKNLTLRREGQFVTFGKLPGTLPGAPKGAEVEDAAERTAALHYWFQPEEVHLREKGEKREQEVEVHMRCVGEGKAQGRLRLLAPKGLATEPQELDIAPLAEGKEQVVRVKVCALAGAENDLHKIRFVPDNGLHAAAEALPVSVGVVMKVDNRLPKQAQFVVRAPSYTFAVGEFSGVSFFVLDGDGHRRHGRMHNTNFIFGFPGVMRDGKWCFRYRNVCRFLWPGKDTLTVGSEGYYNDGDVRLGYTFREDRIAIALVPPTNATIEHTVCLGNFDALGEMRHIERKPAAGQPAPNEWYFFPHPAYRQGALITLPPKTVLKQSGTAVSFPLRTAQEVTLQFVTEAELQAMLQPGKEQ